MRVLLIKKPVISVTNLRVYYLNFAGLTKVLDLLFVLISPLFDMLIIF